MLLLVTRGRSGIEPGASTLSPDAHAHIGHTAEMPQRVTIPGADLILELASGEEIRVEISTKFRVSKIAAELEAAGLGVTRVWTDEAAEFALTLATKPQDA